MKKFAKIFYLIVLFSTISLFFSACENNDGSALKTEEINGFTIAIETDAQESPYGKIISVKIPTQTSTVTTPAFTPNGVHVKVIGTLSFYQQKVWNVNISEGIETIENFAFGYCEELVSVNLPTTTKKIGDYAFANTRYLGFVTILAENPPELGSSAFKTLNENSSADDKYEIPKNLTIKVPDAEKYRTATAWAEYASNIVKN